MKASGMRLLLGSGGLSTKARLNAWRTALDEFLGPVKRFLFVPHALKDMDWYVKRLVEIGSHVGREVDALHRARDPRKAIAEAQAVFVGGGNTFRLLFSMQRLRVLDPLRARVQRGLPYVGISAGTNLACPTIQTTNDMPILWPAVPKALGLVPFQVNPHYVEGPAHHRLPSGRLQRYGGETRDDRLREFHEENERPVLALREGAILRVEGGRARLLPANGARLFLRGKPPRDLRPGTDVTFLLRR
jgi:dipeptidase E